MQRQHSVGETPETVLEGKIVQEEDANGMQKVLGVDNQSSPYLELQRAVQGALETESRLSTSDKVALALEVLRARQLELDLAQTRNNIEHLVSSDSMAPRSLRAVVPANIVRGLPVGAPVEIRNGRFSLSPTPNDPSALFLTLELQNYGPQDESKASRP